MGEYALWVVGTASEYPCGLKFILRLTTKLRIRLFSTKSFKPLGSLKYHREGCFAVSFTRSNSSTPHTDQDAPPVPSEQPEPGQPLQEDVDEDVPEQVPEEPLVVEEPEYDVEELDEDERLKRERWLISGGKDTKVDIWELISLESQPKT